MTSKPSTKSKSVILVGFMGAGKSTIGPLLARRLELPFFDTDLEIERAKGMAISDIFRTVGEQCFRSAEQKTVFALLDSGEKVIAAGGGLFIDPPTREELIRRTRTVWLDPPFAIIENRLERCSGRPIAAARTREELRELWAQRRAAYAHAAVRITAARDDPERVVDDIVDKLQAH